MRNMIPCPSPKGTNHERLYIVRAPKLALDAALDPDDDAQSGAPDVYAELATFLADCLSPEDMGHAEALLTHLFDKTDIGTDEPLPFPGRPRPGGAMDSADLQRRVAVAQQVQAGKRLAQRYQFDRRYPNAVRIRTL